MWLGQGLCNFLGKRCDWVKDYVTFLGKDVTGSRTVWNLGKSYDWVKDCKMGGKTMNLNLGCGAWTQWAWYTWCPLSDSLIVYPCVALTLTLGLGREHNGPGTQRADSNVTGSGTAWNVEKLCDCVEFEEGVWPGLACGGSLVSYVHGYRGEMRPGLGAQETKWFCICASSFVDALHVMTASHCWFWSCIVSFGLQYSI